MQSRNKRLRGRLFALVSLFLISITCFPVRAVAEDLIPFVKGAVWIYRGGLQATVEDSSKVVGSKLQVRQEITDVIKQKDYLVAILKGHPHDVDPFDSKATVKPGRYLLIQLKGQKLYLVQDDDRVGKILARIKSGKLTDADLDINELIIQTPLNPGACFAQEPEYVKAMEKEHSKSNMYGWSVDSKTKALLNSIKLSDATRTALKQADDCTLSYRTNPSTETVHFVPGLGFTQYDYVHHGTVAKYDLHLTQFLPGPSHTTGHKQ